jgi:hypothetical protein
MIDNLSYIIKDDLDPVKGGGQLIFIEQRVYSGGVE